MKKDTFLACLILAVLMLQAKEIVYQYRDEVVHWMKNGGRVVLKKDPSEIRNVNFAYPEISWIFRQYIKTLNKR